jgi:hypothetical protein
MSNTPIENAMLAECAEFLDGIGLVSPAFDAQVSDLLTKVRTSCPLIDAYMSYCADCRDVNEDAKDYAGWIAATHADNAPALEQALKATAELAYELMHRATEIDRKLIEKDGRQPDCELGEVVRLRQQLSKNRVLLGEPKQPVF